MGRKKVQISKEQIERDSGLTRHEFAQKHGISYGKACHLIRESGVRFERNTEPHGQLAVCLEVIARLIAGLPLVQSEIAADVGVSKQRVGQVFKQLRELGADLK